MQINSFGDDFTNLVFDGADDSDEEIEQYTNLKNPYEIKEGMKLSKRGIMQYVDELLQTESHQNKAKPAISKAWESKIKSAGLQVFIKKGGSS